MRLSASSSSEGLITDLLSSDGRCEGGTSRSLQGSRNHQIETSSCRCKPTRLNGFPNCLNYAQHTRSRATNGPRETRSRSKSPGLIDFRPGNRSCKAASAPAWQDCFPSHYPAPWLGASTGTWSRRWANVCSFVGEFFIACARAFPLVGRVSPQRLIQWLRSAGIDRRDRALGRDSITSITIRVDHPTGNSVRSSRTSSAAVKSSSWK